MSNTVLRRLCLWCDMPVVDSMVMLMVFAISFVRSLSVFGIDACGLFLRRRRRRVELCLRYVEVFVGGTCGVLVIGFVGVVSCCFFHPWNLCCVLTTCWLFLKWCADKVGISWMDSIGKDCAELQEGFACFSVDGWQ